MFAICDLCFQNDGLFQSGLRKAGSRLTASPGVGVPQGEGIWWVCRDQQGCGVALAGSGCPPGLLALPGAPLTVSPHRILLHTGHHTFPSHSLALLSSCFPEHTPGSVSEVSPSTPPGHSPGPRGYLVLPPGRGGLLPSAQPPPFSSVCSGVGSLRRDCGLVGTVIRVSTTD